MIISVEEYRRKYPQQHYRAANGGEIDYRYYINPGSDKTLALFVGILGNSDTFYEIFDVLARDYSVLTFNYPVLSGNDRIAEALADLFRHLGIKPWLLGQSLGGLMSQIIAQSYPDLVEGLVLSNTAGLSMHIDKATLKAINNMIAAQDMNRKMLGIMPLGYIRKKVGALDPAVVAKYTPQQKERSDAFSKLTNETLSKAALKNTLGILVDTYRQFGMLPQQFEYLRGKVLLLLSPDDKLFPEGTRNSLIYLMNEPRVDRTLTGGHIAIFLDPEGYAARVRDLIGTCPDAQETAEN